MCMQKENQVRHFRITNKVYRELKVRAAKQGLTLNEILNNLLFPKKPL